MVPNRSHQMSFYDVERLKRIALQPGRTAFLDECGNFGFNFQAEGTSLYYIVCAVVVDNKKIKEIERKVDELRRNNFGKGEMKSSSISGNHTRRAKILTELLLLDFSLIILIADKRKFQKESPLANYRSPFVKYLHQKLYNSMYNVYPKLNIIEDEYGLSEFQEGYCEYIKENRPAPNLFSQYNFDYVKSQNSNIVQIADMIAGSIKQHLIDKKSPNALTIFKSKILDIINFPKAFKEYGIEMSADKFYDVQIYTLAEQCATKYIEKNEHSKEEDIRLRVLFLRNLLFTVRNISKTKYLCSKEIVRWLSGLSEKHIITSSYLYRRIIPQLRDADVIIASSGHGYKIPTSVKDISVYINQTDGIVSPMLNRIENCRKLIRKQTNGTLDILNDPALTKYKRFFGDF